jgi:hypothetical protein
MIEVLCKEINRKLSKDLILIQFKTVCTWHLYASHVSHQPQSHLNRWLQILKLNILSVLLSCTSLSLSLYLFCLFIYLIFVFLPFFSLYISLQFITTLYFEMWLIPRLAQWYSAGLPAGWSGVRVPAGAGNFSLHHRVQTDSGAHPASYPMGIRGSFHGGKRPGREADHSPPYSAEFKACVEPYLHSPNTPSWRGDQLKHRDYFTLCGYVLQPEKGSDIV